MSCIFRGKKYTKEEYKASPYLRYILEASSMEVNPERVASIETIKNNPLVEYVTKSLDILDTHSELSEREYALAMTALLWSEVAKGGRESDRRSWTKKGYILNVHNEASAEIYHDNVQAGLCAPIIRKNGKSLAKDRKDVDIVYALIFTHGLIGQHLRGEVGISVNKPLIDLVDNERIDAESLARILYALNHGIIGAISTELWAACEKTVRKVIDKICFKRNLKDSRKTIDRVKLLFPTAFGAESSLAADEKKLFDDIFQKYLLWYPTVALDSFSREEIVEIFGMIRRNMSEGIVNISFYPFVKNIFYDYEGKKKINVYKKRIIEFCLKEMRQGIADEKSEEHVSFVFEKSDNTINMNVLFTPVCEKLIDFCVEAERSGIMDYQKNITTIFDLFGFRRDVFDRLNNEDKYLDTMNDVQSSRKGELIDYAVGEILVDVGSGGGVLLDALEKKYPEKHVIGTDISTNVIEALNRKKEKEKHSYEVMRHNFVEGPLEEKVDTIIFSSILHEVYSYTELDGRRFNIQSVWKALQNATNSLKKGGRILIRDGVYTDSKRVCELKLKEKDGVKFLQNYMNDFAGLKELKNSDGNWLKEKVSLNGNVLTADINFIREFLYTYTWGEESYALEVNEQFGYFTKREYEECMKKLGMDIIFSEEYLESGYEIHLSPLVEMGTKLSFKDIPSNYMIIAEKRI